DEVLVLLEHRAEPGTLKVVREFAALLPWSVDRQQFRQAVWNLGVNALQAMVEGGELRVSMSVTRSRLLVRVADTGEGIPPVDLVVTDLGMRKVGGLAVLKAAKEFSPRTAVLVVTAFASTETAVEAMKLGAYDYVTKPFKLDELKLTVSNALERRRLQDENQALKRQLRRERGFENFVGRSPKMLDVFETIRKTADSGSTV